MYDAIDKPVKKGQSLYFFAILYLAIPVLIFFSLYLKPFIGWPLALLTVYGIFKSLESCPNNNTLNIFASPYKVFLIIIGITILCLYSGIGGFIWQNPYDHSYRNAIFQDLVRNPWPVKQGEQALCYYFGFWLPSALVGKLFGLEQGYLFQLIWAIIGMFLLFNLIFQYLSHVRISYFIIFVFFSGLDIISVMYFCILWNLPLNASLQKVFDSHLHIELFLEQFNSSSNITLLFWLYNQAIPSWIATSLLIAQRNGRSSGYILGLLLISAPFSVVALFPVALYLIFSNYHHSINSESMLAAPKATKYWESALKEILTFPNLLSLIIAFIFFQFYNSNIAVNKLKLLNIFDFEIFQHYFLYLFLEFGVYMLFIAHANEKNQILKILFIGVLLFPLIVMGHSFDFAWRTNIPAAFYLMLLIMHYWDTNPSKIAKCILILVLCIGAITPIQEISRTLENKSIEQPRAIYFESIFDIPDDVNFENFIADPNSNFFKYLAK